MIPIRQGRISAVVPVTERCENIVALYEEYRAAIAAVSSDFEFIFVLDGNFAHRADELLPLRAHGNVRILRLSRQFGEAASLTAGFEVAAGTTIMTLPAYRQIQPASIRDLLEALGDADLAIARRWPRRDARFNRVQSAVFNAALRHLTDTDFHDLGCSARAFDRRVLSEVRVYGDQHRFLPLLASRQGFKVVEVPLPQSDSDVPARVYGFGVYTRRLLDLFTIFFLTKFTRKPLRFFGLIGASLLTLGLVALTWVVMQRLVFHVALADRPALLLSTLLVVLGVQVLALGLIGELIIFTHASELREYQVAEVVEAKRDPVDRPSGAPDRSAVKPAMRL